MAPTGTTRGDAMHAAGSGDPGYGNVGFSQQQQPPTPPGYPPEEVQQGYVDSGARGGGLSLAGDGNGEGLSQVVLNVH